MGGVERGWMGKWEGPVKASKNLRQGVSRRSRKKQQRWGHGKRPMESFVTVHAYDHTQAHTHARRDRPMHALIDRN